MQVIKRVGRFAAWVMVSLLSLASALMGIVVMVLADNAHWQTLRNSGLAVGLVVAGVLLVTGLPLFALGVAMMHRWRQGYRVSIPNR